jgi:hypothetical protein
MSRAAEGPSAEAGLVSRPRVVGVSGTERNFGSEKRTWSLGLDILRWNTDLTLQDSGREGLLPETGSCYLSLLRYTDSSN